MKIRTYFLGLLGLVAVGLTASCSSDDISKNENRSLVSDGSPRYITVNLVNSDGGAGVRASQYEADPNNATYEDGSATENEVSNAIFFFFNNDGTANVVTGNKVSGFSAGKNYLNVTSFNELGPNHDLTVEEILSTTLVIQVANGDNLPTKMVAVLNIPITEFTENTYSLDNLSSFVKDYKTSHASSGTFVMASSVWSNDDSSIEEIKTSDVTGLSFGAKEQAIASPVKIYVERSLAKVRVALKDFKGATGAGENVTIGDITYVSTGQKIKLNPSDAAETEIYVKLDNWYVTSESNISYLTKNLHSLGNTTGLWENWTWPNFHRSFWAYTPTGEGGFNYLYNKWNPGTAKGYTTGSNEYYTQENTVQAYVANTADNTKLNKDAKVVISAELGYFTGEGEGKTWNALTFGMFGLEKYPITASNDYLLTAALNYLKTQGQLDYWYYEGSTWKQIDESFFTYQGISEYTNPAYAGTNVETLNAAARYESRIILDVTAATDKGQWYKNLQNDATDPSKKAAPADQPEASKITTDNIKTDLATNLPNVKVWTEGKTYYYFPIRHLGSGTAADPGRGFYGVVRNHIYDCTISSLTGLGTPVFDPEEYIIPEKVQEDKDTYVAAQINILSWRVVKNDNIVLGQ